MDTDDKVVMPAGGRRRKSATDREVLHGFRRACLTLQDMADVLQTTPELVRSWVPLGCPCVNLQRKAVTVAYAQLRFNLDHVLAWLASFSNPKIPV